MDDKGTGLGTTEPQAAGTCATCGRPLTQCGPNGECLRCLVSLGFLADGQEADRPAGRGRLTPGPLRYAHFEVEVGADGFPVELGAGAMAITYRARDTVLNSAVALKVIDRRVAQNPGARSRFLREARAAANIHHPNVARVTYYGEQDGECFYAMELVEGGTMEEIRARQTSELPLEQLRNLHLAGQVITLLKSMLAPDPKDRPQAARELLSAVHSCYARFNPEARSRRRRVVLAGAALTLVIAAVALGPWLYQRTRSFTPIERSIAVLPFENRSSDKENAYFVDGIQDEILTRLSKIADLKVISRTSTQHYESAPENLRDVAKQL